MVDPLPSRPHPAMARIWFWRGLGLGILLAPLVSWPVVIPLWFWIRTAGASPVVSFGAAAAIVLCAYVVGLLVWSRLAYGRYTFDFGDRELRIQKGVLFRSSTTLPYEKIQDVVVRSGPLLRMRSLGSLRVRTAVPGSADAFWGEAQLPGVREPERVVEELLRRSRPPRPLGPLPAPSKVAVRTTRPVP